MRSPIIIFLGLLLCCSGPVWGMGSLSSSLNMKDPLIGKPAPDVVLPTSNGNSHDVIASRKGHKAVVVFWATWCPHCREELQTLQQILPSLEKQGIKVILVDVGETKGEVKNYLQGRGVQLVSFVDEENVLQDPYHLVGIPTLVFVDSKGIIRDVTHIFPSNYQDHFKSAA